MGSRMSKMMMVINRELVAECLDIVELYVSWRLQASVITKSLHELD